MIFVPGLSQTKNISRSCYYRVVGNSGVINWKQESIKKVHAVVHVQKLEKLWETVVPRLSRELRSKNNLQ